MYIDLEMLMAKDIREMEILQTRNPLDIPYIGCTIEAERSCHYAKDRTH